MKKTPLMSGRCLMVAAVSALLPLTVAQADDRGDYRSYDQGTSGAQGPMRSDIDSSTPTYSGEDRRQFQDQTPGSQGPVRSETPGWTGDSTMHDDSTRMQMQRDEYERGMRGAEGPTRSELEAQGYTGDRMSDRSMSANCPSSTSEKFAPNAYYGESNPFYSEQGKASFYGRGRWC